MKTRLGYKISLLLIAMTMLAVVLLSYKFVSTSRTATEVVLKDYQISISDEIAGVVRTSVSGLFDQLYRVESIFNDSSQTAASKVAMVRWIIQSSKTMNFVAVYDERGKLIDIQKDISMNTVSVIPESLNVGALSATGKSVSNLMFSRVDSLPFLQLIIPWERREGTSTNRRLGYLCTALPFAPFSALVAELSSRRYSGRPDFVCLVNDHGEIVAHSDVNKVKQRLNLLSTDLFAERDTNSLRVLFRRDIGYSKEYTNIDRTKVLASFVTLSDFKIGILVEEPVDEAFASINSMTRQLILWGVASVLVAIVIGIFFSRTITKPIRVLVAATQDIAHGRYGTVVSTRAHDEVADLTSAFNRMSADLKKSFDELREANDHIVKAEKMAIRGEILAEVSHELKNILQIMMLQSASLRRSIDAFDRDHFIETLERHDRQLKRIMTFSENLLVRSGTSQNICRTDVHQLLTSFSTFIRVLPKFKMGKVETRLVGDTCHAMLDSDQIRQVLLNLANNAAEASPGCTLVLQDETQPGGQTATITVSDNGPGIPAEILPKLFHERITTKKDGHGFGLPICGKIVESMNGVIRVESSPGAGTSFIVTLPTEVSPVKKETPPEGTEFSPATADSSFQPGIS